MQIHTQWHQRTLRGEHTHTHTHTRSKHPLSVETQVPEAAMTPVSHTALWSVNSVQSTLCDNTHTHTHTHTHTYLPTGHSDFTAADSLIWISFVFNHHNSASHLVVHVLTHFLPPLRAVLVFLLTDRQLLLQLTQRKMVRNDFGSILPFIQTSQQAWCLILSVSKTRSELNWILYCYCNKYNEIKCSHFSANRAW